MTSREFLKFINLKGNAIPIEAFMIGTFYSIYRFDRVNGLNFFLLLISIFFITIICSSISNYVQYIREIGRNKNIKFEDFTNISETAALKVIWIFIFVGGIFSLLLSINSNLIVALALILLLSNLIKFAFRDTSERFSIAKIYYSITSILLVFFLSVYINIFDNNVIIVSYINEVFTISFFLKEFNGILILAIPTILFIINFFFARDLANYTDKRIFDYYVNSRKLGERTTVIIIGVLYFLSYFFIIILPILGFVEYIYIFSALSIIKVYSNYKVFSMTPKNERDAKLIFNNIFVLNNVNLFMLILIALLKEHILKL